MIKLVVVAIEQADHGNAFKANVGPIVGASIDAQTDNRTIQMLGEPDNLTVRGAAMGSSRAIQIIHRCLDSIEVVGLACVATTEIGKFAAGLL